jgi:hypothetical protein
MEANIFSELAGNVLQYSGLELAMWKKSMTEQTAYTPFTTFYSDLSIAECSGPAGIQETHDRVLKTWMGDYKYMTEYIMCLNHKIWEWHDEEYEKRRIRLLYDKSKREEISTLYDKLWSDAEEKFFEHYAGNNEAMEYYYEITD